MQDAALYVNEGEKDAKIFHHPEGHWSRRAFKTLHHPAFCVFHLIASVLLMFLAFIETPLFFEGKPRSTHQQNKILLSVGMTHSDDLPCCLHTNPYSAWTTLYFSLYD